MHAEGRSTKTSHAGAATAITAHIKASNEWAGLGWGRRREGDTRGYPAAIRWLLVQVKRLQIHLMARIMAICDALNIATELIMLNVK